MSILRVDRISPFQSSSVQIDGAVTLPTMATTGSNIFVGDQEIQGTLTASLQEGYVWVGGADGVSTLVATSSLATGQIDITTLATTGSNNFRGNQNVSGSLTVSGSITQRGIGEANTFIGDGAGAVNNPTLGRYNTFIGNEAGAANTIGQVNLAIGPDALNSNIAGDFNIAIGSEAGRFAGGASNVTSNNSIFIGHSSNAKLDNQTNQIVIGHGVEGNGSNTVVIGDTSITSTTLRGKVSSSLFSGSFVGNGSGLTGIAIATGSFATTGSNTFRGNQTISGSVGVSGSVNADSFTLDASSTINIPVLNDSFDLDFSGSISNFIEKSLVLGDGKILVAGRFSSIDGHTTNDIARLNSNGTIDTSFAAPIFSGSITGDAGGFINTFVTQSDSKILVGGNFSGVNGSTRRGLARLETNGTLDTTFVTQSFSSFSTAAGVRDIVIQNDGKIVCVGDFISGSRRINTDGTLDTSFDIGREAIAQFNNQPTVFNNGEFYSVALLNSASQQEILIGGEFQGWGSFGNYNFLVKLTPSGSLDSGFAGSNLDIMTGDASDRIEKIKVDSDNNIYIAGRFRDTGIGNHAGFAKVLTTDAIGDGRGALDNGFRTYITNSFVNDFDFYDGDKILLGGSFTTFGNPSFFTTSANRFVVVEQNDGGLVTNWLTDALSAKYNLNTGSVNSVTLLPNNNVLLGGTFTQANSTAREGLASLKLTGFGDITTTTDYSITGNINELLISSSNTRFSGNQTVNGDLRVNGNLTATQYIVSSSVSHITTSFSSGSTQFGDSVGDTHQFTGSILVKGDQTISGSLFLSGSARGNFVIRETPLAATPTGFSNTIIGFGAGKDITSGTGNIFLGREAGFRNTSGGSNTFIGRSAGYYTTGDSQNSFVGNEAGEYNQAADNTSLGYRSLRNNVSGVGNVSIGSRSGERTRSGGENGSSTTSIFIGNDARPDAMSQTNQIVIGATAIGNGSNTVVIGNASITSTTLRGKVSSSLFSGSFVGNGSGLTGIPGVTPIETGSFATTGSNTFIGNQIVTGSVTISGSISQDGLGVQNIVISNAPITTLTTATGLTAIGYGAGQDITTGYDNTFIGNQAGRNNTTGYINTFVGGLAGLLNTTGIFNTFIGRAAGQFNTEGQRNTFVGTLAGQVSTGDYNTFLGAGAGALNTTAGSNTFVGNDAGATNSTAQNNTFVGEQAGRYNTSGSGNTFIGQTAGWLNSTAASNTYVGYAAGQQNTSGSNNTFIGASTGYSNTRGDGNTFIGHTTGYNNSVGTNNVFTGRNAGFSNTSGSNNTFVGNFAGLFNTTADDNAFFGFNAGKDNSVGTNNTFIGPSAGEVNTSGSNNTFLGERSGFSNTEGFSNTFLGAGAGISNVLGGYNVAVGHSAASSQAANQESIFIGYNSQPQANSQTNQIVIGYSTTGKGSNTVTLGNDSITATHLKGDVIVSSSILISGSLIPNVGAGNATSSFSLGSPTAAWKDIYVSQGTIRFLDGQGNSQGTLSTTAAGIQTDGDIYISSPSPVRVGRGAGTNTLNTIVGLGSLNSNTTGTSNSAVGASALNSNTTGYENTAMGGSALAFNSVGYYNTAFGQGALYLNQSGSANTAIGDRALFGNSNSSNNTALGYETLLNASAGFGNTSIGFQAGYFASGSSTLNVYLGYEAGPTASIQENFKLYIDNRQTEKPLIGGDFQQREVVINGKLNVNNSTTISGSLSQIGLGSGNIIFTDTPITTLNATAPLGIQNTIVGSDAGQSITDGYSNSFFGRSAGRDTTTATNNTFIGLAAGQQNISGSSNTFLGSSAGQSNKASLNTFVGNNSGNNNTIGTSNTFVGHNSGVNTSIANDNTFIGSTAGALNQSGSSNTLVGAEAAYSNEDGVGSTMVGFQAGRGITAGSYNTILGFRAGGYQPDYITPLANTGNSIFIGADATGISGTVNQIVIGYNAVGKGSNTVVIGNNDITATHLKGAIVLSQVSSSFNFADDTAAQSGGIPLGGLYHTSGSMKIRLV